MERKPKLSLEKYESYLGADGLLWRNKLKPYTDSRTGVNVSPNNLILNNQMERDVGATYLIF